MKAKKILIIAYIIVTALSALYINAVLKEGDAPSPKKEKPKAVEQKSVNVTLEIHSNGYIQTFNQDMRNVDTVLELLTRSRNRDTFIFEKTLYTWGWGIDSVNRTTAPEGYVWAIFDGETNITPEFDKTYLDDKKVYVLKLAPVSN